MYPARGIEKCPLGVSGKYIVKKLYLKNLHQAIQDGDFDDKQKLLEASKQIVEGLLILIEIGAMYFDVKLANILVGRKTELDVAFTDFERISFLSFHPDEDRQIIKNVHVRIPYFLTDQNEASKLAEIQKSSPERFIEKLHQHYVFALGAIFFEMATRMPLSKFIFLKALEYFLKVEKIDEERAFLLTELAKNLPYEELSILFNLCGDEVHQLLAWLIGKAKSPDAELLAIPEVAEQIPAAIIGSGASELYAVLVSNMIKQEPSDRIGIEEIAQNIQKQLVSIFSENDERYEM